MIYLAPEMIILPLPNQERFSLTIRWFWLQVGSEVFATSDNAILIFPRQNKTSTSTGYGQTSLKISERVLLTARTVQSISLLFRLTFKTTCTSTGMHSMAVLTHSSITNGRNTEVAGILSLTTFLQFLQNSGHSSLTLKVVTLMTFSIRSST